jgi:kynurenine formamidase
MIDLSKYRMIDLSKKIVPGTKRVSGEYAHGNQIRRMEARQFIFKPDGMLMYWVDTESHIGTHVEGPSHHPDAEKCLTDLHLDTFIGEAAVLNLSGIEPVVGVGQPVLPSDLGEVRKGDIVLMWSSLEGPARPYISPEAAQHLLKVGAKMIGIQGVGLEAPDSMASHDTLLLNDIPIIEGIENLDKIKRKRVFYMGLPIKITEIDSSWIRAVVLEEK